MSIAFLLLFSGQARADKAEALKHYEKARIAYNVGRFDEAIVEFKAAYEEDPKPQYLFDLGQAYRKAGDCEQARFFYGRYLSEKPEASNRAEVESKIAEVKRECEEKTRTQQQPAEAKTEALTSTATPEANRVRSGLAGAEASATLIEARDEPKVVIVAQGGLSSISSGDVKTPIEGTAHAGASYRLAFGAVSVEPGVMATLTTIPFSYRPVTGAPSSGTAIFSDFFVVANAGLSLLSILRAFVEIGGGVEILSGLDRPNPFTTDFAPRSSPLIRPAGVFGLGLDAAIGSTFMVRVTPVSITVAPGSSSLRSAAGDLHRIEALAGLGLMF